MTVDGLASLGYAAGESPKRVASSPSASPARPRAFGPRLAGALGIWFGAMGTGGCGGGAPLLHGAHALSPGVINAGAGFSSNFATGELRRASDPSVGRGTETGANGAAALAAIAPSVAPWVGARVGLTGDNEAGITYTGRAARVDIRHAFEDGKLAWSAGVGANTIFSGSDQTSNVPGPNGPPRFQVALGSFGFDVPLLVGWRSDAGIVTAWAGARGGYERISGHALPLTGALPEPSNGLATEMTKEMGLHHGYVGGVAGFAVGFRRVHVAFELDTYYQWVSGDYAEAKVKLNGVTLAPSSALLFTF